MAILAVQQVDVDGLTPLTEVSAAGGGDSFPNDGARTFLMVKNGSGSPMTVTVDDTGSTAPSGAKSFDADVDISVGAGDDALIGPFPRSRFTGLVEVAYSDEASVTVSVFRL